MPDVNKMAEEMEGVVLNDGAVTAIDVNEKTTDEIRALFPLLERAVQQFDTRFTLRALRAISSIRKKLSDEVLVRVVGSTYQPDQPPFRILLQSAGIEPGNAKKILDSVRAKEEEKASADKQKDSKKEANKEVIPEVDVFLSILVQVYLYDKKEWQRGADFSTKLVDSIRSLNRRTLDSLGAKAYFYLSLFYEQLDPKPPSKQAKIIEVRSKLLAALRSAVLRRDQDTQAAVIVLLMRNYLSTADITQADALVSQIEFPTTAPNNQVARYLYYLGRIRAVQLRYTEAHEHLVSATRKAPSNSVAAGFYQASTKFLIVVELLMGDIPERSIFSQPKLEAALEPYFQLVKAVRTGEMQGYLRTIEEHGTDFQKDGTLTLVKRLRQNVIRTGIRMLSLSYSRISLRDICLRLGLESEESAEYIVAKAIRDGVIEASLNHEKGFMQTKKAGDIYATREPAEAFHERIKACLGLHDECVRAMRYPSDGKLRGELREARLAKEREREVMAEIEEGGDPEDGDGGDFEGL